MDTGTIAMIVSAVLGLLTFLGISGLVMKKLKAVKESADVLTAAIMALSDGKVTADEIQDILDEFEEAKQAWMK